MSLRETDDLPSNLIANFDKVLHVSAYIVLTILWAFTLNTFKQNIKTTKLLTIVFIGLLLYGIIIEVLQSKVTTTRLFEVNDLFANVSGIILGALLYKFVVKPKLKSN